MKLIFILCKGLWNVLNFCRRVVMNIIFLSCAFILFAVTATIWVQNKPVKPLNQKVALRLNLDGILADTTEQESLRQLLQSLNGQDIPQKLSTFEIEYAISKAKEDKNITGLVVDLNHFVGGDIPSINYIGKAIQDFKKSGKPVIAVADSYDQKQYLLASYADKIYLNSQGTVDITGLGTSNFYYKSLLDKLDATPHIFRVGTYKSAVEPFLRDDMSPEAKTNQMQWLGTMWHNIQQQIATNRQIKPEQVLPAPQELLAEVKQLGGNLTQYALNHHFATQALTRLEISQILRKEFGETKDYSYKAINWLDYLDRLPPPFTFIGKTENQVAIVNVEGTIIDGESDQYGVGGDTVARLLRQALNNHSIKAVVLRVNSPGGSAFASEIIRQEVSNLQAAGKPVIVSMGGLAASGGYWISSTADYIVADPNTLTGSIGIFAAFVTLENSLKKIGIYSDGVETSPFRPISPLQQLSPQNADLIQLSIENGYQNFLSIVAKGRKMTTAEVDQIAQGRVWLGQDALKHKLVDQLGNLDTAIEIAQERIKATLPDNQKDKISVTWLQEKNITFLNAILAELQRSSINLLGQQGLSLLGIKFNSSTYQTLQQLNQLTRFNDPKGQYIYCLNCGVVQ
ncbi:signal peptide peptidase SppA [Mergibacter septicus]|uniref:signal peptide peptidase SppA n=1 Tax=Mergibacter septicus TaxID=221402 RepID=UPI001C7595EB|nr:signal peptide peptidase SppA [Mergibacter septicus]QDJ13196.1 signal peptide peptidase SppA [Mergibacter septicus]